jgi:hypothetical protein
VQNLHCKSSLIPELAVHPAHWGVNRFYVTLSANAIPLPASRIASMSKGPGRARVELLDRLCELGFPVETVHETNDREGRLSSAGRG